MNPKRSTLIGNEESHLHIAAIIFFLFQIFSKITAGSDYIVKLCSLWALIHVIIWFYLSHLLLWTVIP